ncbi:adenosylcobinamide-phosphate synthase [Williamsia muralis]|uniref:Cobalamin biosynthesis protein CobD n=1 Tax=Williamsia marianensis TaxID=85044 RepID=A0A495K120_WILMA|nr:cobalamin biosynthesis protein [Williamsia muralis]RKR94957.1 adenosylcobinamide-phosphate synthase [Williamsia muralis]
MVTAGWDRALGLTAGYLLDRIFGDPTRYHPVAGMGIAAGRLESVLYRDSRWAGTMFTVTCVGVVTGAGMMGRRSGVLPTALITWATLGGTSLTSVGERLADSLASDDLEGARALIPSLCGRDPNSLDADGMARAALESVAENTSDATVGPLVWGAIAGIPGLLAYRMINTLDAMVGYRNSRYLNFGWASARLDDAASFLPARLTALLVVALGDDRAGAATAVRRDASAHPSPNAGVVEASFAGALGVELGGVTVYRHRTEIRPTLGDGRAPTDRDLYRAAALSRRVQIGALATVAVGQLVVRRARRS